MTFLYWGLRFAFVEQRTSAGPGSLGRASVARLVGQTRYIYFLSLKKMTWDVVYDTNAREVAYVFLSSSAGLLSERIWGSGWGVL